jgi:hypothetical protein
MEQRLLKIISDYIEIVARTLALLEDNFGRVNYVSAKGTEKVPQRGFLDKEKKISYNLHGIGITVDYEDISIVFDFDFHSNNHFGFNAWQLERFTKVNPQKYPDLSKLNYGELESAFQDILNDLEKRGDIEFNEPQNRYYPK